MTATVIPLRPKVRVFRRCVICAAPSWGHYCSDTCWKADEEQQHPDPEDAA